MEFLCFGIVTKGGLSLIGTAQKGRPVILGSGPIFAIAKIVASEKAPDIIWELSKSEDMVDPRAYMHLLPEYSALTDVMDAIIKSEQE